MEMMPQTNNVIMMVNKTANNNRRPNLTHTKGMVCLKIWNVVGVVVDGILFCGFWFLFIFLPPKFLMLSVIYCCWCGYGSDVFG